MKSNYDFLTEALKNLDEKYIAETAECLSVPKNSSGRNITIDSEELIEIKNGIRKSNCVSAIIAVAAVFICVIVTSMFLIMNDNRVQALGSTPSDGFSDYSENNQSTQSKNENPSPDAGNNDFSELSNTVIQNMTKIDENTLLTDTEKYLQLVDLTDYKIVKEIPKSKTLIVQKFDGGFMIIDSDNFYEIYDVKGNKIKHIDIPKIQLEDRERTAINKMTLCISDDGKNIAYYGYKGLCINSVDLDNEIVMQTAEEVNDGFGEYPLMTKPYAYKNGIIYGEASKINQELNKNEFFFASFDTKTKEWKIYHKLDDKQQIFTHYYPFAENSFIIIDAGANSQATEGKLHYFVIGDTEMNEFVCEEGYESTKAFISGNAKYILTTYEHSMNEAEIKLYDTSTGEALISEKADHNVQTAYIDEESRKLYIAGSGNFIVKNF